MSAVVACLAVVAALLLIPAVSARAADSAAAPPHPVKLVFIHHSVGENWLADGYGNLGSTLAANNYFVSDTNYGWGPGSIGDRTDIPDWLEWFRSSQTATYTSALFAEAGQHSSYSRLADDPGGSNQIVMFKSCFPNSSLDGNAWDGPDATPGLTVGHAKYVYGQLLTYFASRPDKLFVVITAPPNSDSSRAANARAFNNWLVRDWLVGYTGSNVAVFDFYNVLTGPANHHQFVGGVVEHTYAPGMDTTYYPTGDDHPSGAGSRKATGEFVPLLNVAYNRWIAGVPPTPPVVPVAPAGPTRTAIAGWPSKAVARRGKVMLNVTLTPAAGRSAAVQKKVCTNRCRWTRVATVGWPWADSGSTRVVLKVRKGATAVFRLAVPRTDSATSLTTRALTVRGR